MSEQDAINNYNDFKSIDPFPRIPGTLLNSADIRSYVNRIGLIYPFHEKDLKSASYAARIAGKCKFWDEELKRFVEKDLKSSGDKIILKPNSIAFVGIEPTFRLPDYIALRFNLKITHVYRGLLLGTGPLIDPGFVGKISIPLHNLTSNEYIFSFNESLIWIEFTKTSPRPDVPKISDQLEEAYELQRCKEFIPFPSDKTLKDLDYYLNRALEGTRHEAVVSSVPSAVGEAMKHARDAQHSLKIIKRWAIGGAIALITTIFFGMGTIIYGSYSIQKDYFSEAISQVNILKSSLAENISTTNEQLNSIESEIYLIKEKIQKIDAMNIQRINKNNETVVDKDENSLLHK